MKIKNNFLKVNTPKFPHEGRVVTIAAETETAVTTLKLAPEEVPISPSFKVCVIYEDDLDERVMSMMRKMSFMPGIGLEKDQRGSP